MSDIDEVEALVKRIRQAENCIKFLEDRKSALLLYQARKPNVTMRVTTHIRDAKVPEPDDGCTHDIFVTSDKVIKSRNNLELPSFADMHDEMADAHIGIINNYCEKYKNLLVDLKSEFDQITK